jgi:hypothetical protein
MLAYHEASYVSFMLPALMFQNVIQTQLPALMLKEFSVDHETEFFAAKSAVSMNECP